MGFSIIEPNNLRHFRETSKSDLTQSDVIAKASEFGGVYSITQVSKMEAGEKSLKDSDVEVFSKVYRQPMDLIKDVEAIPGQAKVWASKIREEMAVMLDDEKRLVPLGMRALRMKRPEGQRSVESMARAAGLDMNTYYSHESGARPFEKYPENAAKIAEAFGFVDYDAMFEHIRALRDAGELQQALDSDTRLEKAIHFMAKGGFSHPLMRQESVQPKSEAPKPVKSRKSKSKASAPKKKAAVAAEEKQAEPETTLIKGADVRAAEAKSTVEEASAVGKAGDRGIGKDLAAQAASFAASKGKGSRTERLSLAGLSASRGTSMTKDVVVERKAPKAGLRIKGAAAAAPEVAETGVTEAVREELKGVVSFDVEGKAAGDGMVSLEKTGGSQAFFLGEGDQAAYRCIEMTRAVLGPTVRRGARLLVRKDRDLIVNGLVFLEENDGKSGRFLIVGTNKEGAVVGRAVMPEKEINLEEVNLDKIWKVEQVVF